MIRIESFLKEQGLDISSVPRQRIKQLLMIDVAVQKRLQAIKQAQKIVKDNSISIVSIANDSGITRKTFYNNEILKTYVESFTSIDGEPGKLVKASEISNMKKRIAEQSEEIAKMAARDIDIETLRHEADELRKVISNKDKQIQNLTELYENILLKLHQEHADKRNVVPFHN